MSVGPLSEKFNIVSNHGHMQKCNIYVSVCKTNFADHHTPDTIHGYKDSVLICKMHDCSCTIRKHFEHFHSFPSSDEAIAMANSLMIWKQTALKCL